jgi:hypothetical protein
MYIFKDFLSEEYKNTIREQMNSEIFPWYFCPYTTKNDMYQKGFQFTHTGLYNKNKYPFYDVVYPMLHILQEKANVKIKNLYRIKANLITQGTPIDFDENVHRDGKSGLMSLLYYVNDSDGDTLFLDDDKKTIIQQVKPEENKALFFKSDIWHCSNAPINYKNRIIINFVLDIE